MKAEHPFATSYDVIGDYYYKGEHLLFGNRIPPFENKHLEEPFQRISFKFPDGNIIKADEDGSLEKAIELRRRRRAGPDFDKWEPNFKQRINKDLYWPKDKPWRPKIPSYLKNSIPVFVPEPEVRPITTYQRSYQNFLVPYYKNKDDGNRKFPFYDEFIMNPKRPNYHEIVKVKTTSGFHKSNI